MSRSAQSAESFLVQLGPGLRAGAEHQQANRLPAVAQRHHEHPHAAVLAAVGIAHHGTVAVVHLRFFAGRSFDHHARFRRGDSALLANEPLDAVVAPREAMVVYQILPDGHRVAATRQIQFDDFPVWLTRAGAGTAAGLPFRWRKIGRFFGRRVGGHLYGRFCRRGRIPAPTTRRPNRNPRRLQVAGGRFPPDACRLLNPPQRPAEPAQGNHLLFLFFAQDIAHIDGAYSPSGSMS